MICTQATATAISGAVSARSESGGLRSMGYLPTLTTRTHKYAEPTSILLVLHMRGKRGRQEAERIICPWPAAGTGGALPPTAPFGHCATPKHRPEQVSPEDSDASPGDGAGSHTASRAVRMAHCLRHRPIPLTFPQPTAQRAPLTR